MRDVIGFLLSPNIVPIIRQSVCTRLGGRIAGLYARGICRLQNIIAQHLPLTAKMRSRHEE